MSTADDSPAFAIRLRHISKHFEGVTALDDVEFEVRSGEVHCLAGENGCGKSTLIKIVTGVYSSEVDAEIELFGERLTHITPSSARALGIAVIWQDLALFPHMTVAENIAFDQMVGNRPRFARLKKLRADARAALARLGIALDLDARLKTLSISQRQIVAIARALMGTTRLIFMDEPTASLTQTETDHLIDIVRILSAQGVAIVFVSHRLAEVLEISSRVTVLRDGRLVGVYPTAGMTQTRLGKLMTGTSLQHAVTARDCSGARVVLEATSLTRTGEFHDVSFSIRAGEVLGLTGLIGAGRTELALALVGMSQPDTGHIRLNGSLIKPRSIRDAIDAGIAYVSEDRLSLGLIQPQSIADNVSITVLDRMLGRTSTLISQQRKAALVAHWIQELAVKIGHADDPVSTLSGGNQQRLVLAKWLAIEPKVLILDSPTVGVDVGARVGIFRIVRELAGQGLAILLISDEVTEVVLNADRILHMAGGRMVGEHIPQEGSVEVLEAQIYA